MTIATYAELKTAVANWTHRADADARVSEFVVLAEARLNTKLRVRQMEAALASTALASGLITRPTDAVAFRALWSDSNTYPPVEQKSLEYVLQHGSDGSIPQFYAWDRTYLRFNTLAGNVAGVYYESIDALSDVNTTNWLLTARPDVYLACAIAEAYQYSLDPAAGEWIAKSEALIEEMNTRDQRDRFSGNSLVVRIA